MSGLDHLRPGAATDSPDGSPRRTVRETSRRRFADRLLGDVLAGHTVVILGPSGIGKTTLLRELLGAARACGRPWGFAPRTARLGDLTRALAQAYPTAGRTARTPRAMRGSLRLAVEDRPGVLLLDHLVTAGTAMRGYLRSLDGTGLGIVLAADADTPRERARVRAFGLAHREFEVPAVGARALTAMLEAGLASRSLPGHLTPQDRRRLVRGARGCPGRIERLLGLLEHENYWRRGRPLCYCLTTAVEDTIAAGAGEPTADSVWGPARATRSPGPPASGSPGCTTDDEASGCRIAPGPGDWR